MSNTSAKARLQSLFKQNIQSRSQQVVVITLGGGLEVIPDNIWGYSFRYLQVTGRNYNIDDVLAADCAVIDLPPKGSEALIPLLQKLRKNPDVLLLVESISRFSDDVKSELLAFAPRLISADEFKNHGANETPTVIGEGGRLCKV